MRALGSCHHGGERLTEAEIKAVTAYVLQLGGGE